MTPDSSCKMKTEDFFSELSENRRSLQGTNAYSTSSMSSYMLLKCLHKVVLNKYRCVCFPNIYRLMNGFMKNFTDLISTYMFFRGACFFPGEHESSNTAQQQKPGVDGGNSSIIFTCTQNKQAN